MKSCEGDKRAAEADVNAAGDAAAAAAANERCNQEITRSSVWVGLRVRQCSELADERRRPSHIYRSRTHGD